MKPEVKLGAERATPVVIDDPEKTQVELAVPVEKPKREKKREGATDGPT